MEDGAPGPSPWPEHPDLRDIASKDLIERLDADDAKATGLDSDAVAYTTLGKLAGASDKAVRDARTIAVTPL